MPEFTPAPSSGGASTTTATPRVSAEQYLLNGSPAGTFRETYLIDLCKDTCPSPGTGVMLLTAVPVFAGDVIARAGFQSRNTAAVTPTNWWFALYDSSLTLLRQTADQLTAQWQANTPKELAFSSSYTVPADTVLYAGVMMAAATPNNFAGSLFVTTQVSAGLFPVSAQTQRLRGGTNGTGLTTTAPAGPITLTSVTSRAYCVLMS